MIYVDSIWLKLRCFNGYSGIEANRTIVLCDQLPGAIQQLEAYRIVHWGSLLYTPPKTNFDFVPINAIYIHPPESHLVAETAISIPGSSFQELDEKTPVT